MCVVMKDQLFGKDLNELQEIGLALGLPKFTGKQLPDWLYKKEISSIDEMSNLSKNARELLNEKYEYGISAPSKGAEMPYSYFSLSSSLAFFERLLISSIELISFLYSQSGSCFPVN